MSMPDELEEEGKQEASLNKRFINAVQCAECGGILERSEAILYANEFHHDYCLIPVDNEK
jgi:hypothetical protein